MSLFKGINVVSVTVPDLEAARRFYQETLELGEPAYDLPDMGWIEFRTGGSGDLAVVAATGPFTPSPNITLVLNVDDCHQAVAALRAKGVKCDDVVEIPGVVTYASFYDPFGNQLQMCS